MLNYGLSSLCSLTTPQAKVSESLVMPLLTSVEGFATLSVTLHELWQGVCDMIMILLFKKIDNNPLFKIWNSGM